VRGLYEDGISFRQIPTVCKIDIFVRPDELEKWDFRELAAALETAPGTAQVTFRTRFKDIPERHALDLFCDEIASKAAIFPSNVVVLHSA